MIFKDRRGKATTVPKYLPLEWTESLSFEEHQNLLESISGTIKRKIPNKRFQSQTQSTKAEHFRRGRSGKGWTFPPAIRACPSSHVEVLVNEACEQPLFEDGVGLFEGRSCFDEDNDDEDDLEEGHGDNDGDDDDDNHNISSKWETLCHSYSSGMRRKVGNGRSSMELLGDFDRELDTIAACLSSQDSNEVLEFHYDATRCTMDTGPSDDIGFDERCSSVQVWNWIAASMDEVRWLISMECGRTLDECSSHGAQAEWAD